MSRLRKANQRVMKDMPDFLKFLIPVLLVIAVGSAISATLFTSGWWPVGVLVALVTCWASIVVAEAGLSE